MKFKTFILIYYLHRIKKANIFRKIYYTQIIYEEINNVLCNKQGNKIY